MYRLYEGEDEMKLTELNLKLLKIRMDIIKIICINNWHEGKKADEILEIIRKEMVK